MIIMCVHVAAKTHLFHSDADTHGVDGALDQNLLFVISADDDWLQQQLFAAPVTKYRVVCTVNVESNGCMAAFFISVRHPNHSPNFHFRLVVTFNYLRGEIL